MPEQNTIKHIINIIRKVTKYIIYWLKNVSLATDRLCNALLAGDANRTLSERLLQKFLK